MRKITQQTEDGEKMILIFTDEAEREDYFATGDRKINESQAKSLADLRSAYISNTSKARSVRSSKGKKTALETFDSINQFYREELKKTHDLYARARANLRSARETSLIESQIPETPPA